MVDISVCFLDRESDALVREILQIGEVWNRKFEDTRSISDYKISSFVQLWGNTSGGLEGWGGSAMTEERTTVFVKSDYSEAVVFFGSHFGYICKCQAKFQSDLLNRRICGVCSAREVYELI